MYNKLKGIEPLYYVVSSLARNYGGMMIALPEREWASFRTLDAQGLAAVLRELAGHVDLARYAKPPRGPKKPPPKRHHDPKHPHVSTSKLLEQRRQSKKRQELNPRQGSDSPP